jgi:hypothetical protein
MSLEEKLNQIRSLLAQRDAIDQQLEGIIGHYGPKPLTVHDKVRKHDEKISTGRPKQRVCSKCLKPGHNAKTCPQATSLNPNDTSEKVKSSTTALTEDEWAEVRARKRDGDEPEDIADACSLPLTEVKTAYNCPSFFVYRRMHLRNK